MSLYKHVANKEELLDGMVDVIVCELDPPMHGADWKDATRRRILSARQALLRHRWASQVIESRTHAKPVVLDIAGNQGARSVPPGEPHPFRRIGQLVEVATTSSSSSSPWTSSWTGSSDRWPNAAKVC